MAANRIAWSLTAGLFVATAIVLLISGYDGYAGVFLAVAVAAAVNLVPLGTKQR